MAALTTASSQSEYLEEEEEEEEEEAVLEEMAKRLSSLALVVTRTVPVREFIGGNDDIDDAGD